MQGNKDVLKALNAVLKNELTAINQYFLHARMHKNWGLEALNKSIYKQSIRVMKEADDLIERILFLEGLPNLQNLGALSIGENPIECLKADLQFEVETQRPAIAAATKLAESLQDYGTRDLLNELMEHCEEAIDWYETQISLIESTGSNNYLQSQM